MLSSCPLRWGGLTVSTARKLGVGLFYAAIAGLGAAYAVFEHHQANRLAHLINEMMPAFLALILVFVYCVFRMAVSAVKELNGVSLAAQAPCGLR